MHKQNSSTLPTQYTTIPVKVLSQNRAWFGRRFKTKAYLDFEEMCNWRLPRNLVVPEGDLEVHLLFGMSNKLSDVDGGIKCFVDVLQHKYDFNDRRIFKLIAEKVIVKKGFEYISFSITSYCTD